MESQKLTSEANEKRNQLPDTENKRMVTSGERGEGRWQDGGGEYEVQTTLHRINDKGPLYSTGDTANGL